MIRTIQLAIACMVVLVATTRPVQAGVLTTQYNTNNAQSGNMFDVEVFASPLLVTSLDLNLAPGTWNIELYTKAGSYQGSQGNAAAWNFIDSVSSVASNGVNNPTPVDFLDFGLLADTTYGFYVTTTSEGGPMLYTNGSAVGNVAASNADLQIFEGAGIAYPFNGTFEPRIWNGSIHYELQSVNPVPEPASLAIFGIGACVAGVGTARRRRHEKKHEVAA